MVPTTMSGRIFCICFGLFGIPLLLITIADIGKFLSELITFFYKQFRKLKWKLRERSRRVALRKRAKAAGIDQSMDTDSLDLATTPDMSSEIHIPIWMVIVFLATYTACGGLLFRSLEGWEYFEAFYFLKHLLRSTYLEAPT
jgi:hypothetical protein